MSGLAGALALWFLVEPKLQRAITLEEDGAVGGYSGGPDAHTLEVIGRGQQTFAGLIVIVVVGLLVGLIFALVYSWTRDQLPGIHDFGKSLTLAGLGFVVVALGPGLAIPANPPGVGETATVAGRTQTYLFVLTFLVLLVVGCFTVMRACRGSVAARGTAVVVLIATGVALITVALPDTSDGISEEFAAGLLWDFRVASLAQHAIMWVTTGVVFGWAVTPSGSDRSQRRLRRRFRDDAVRG